MTMPEQTAFSSGNSGSAKSELDSRTSVKDLREVVAKFVRERNWEQFHNPKNLAMSLSIEAAELMEHFQWLTLAAADNAVQEPESRAKIAEEVADCLAYVLALANVMQLDLASTLRAKMEKNALKYPIDQAYGRWGADDDGRR